MKLDALLPRVVLRFTKGGKGPELSAESYHAMRHISHRLLGTMPAEGDDRDTDRIIGIAKLREGIK